MTDSDVPKGQLTVGAIGSFLAALGFILFFFLIFSPVSDLVGMRGGERAVEGFFMGAEGTVVLITALFAVGNLMAFSGYLGLGKVYSGAAITAGVFGLILGAAALFLLLVGLLGIVAMAEGALAIFGGAVLLAALFAPIGMFPTNGLGKGAGTLLLLSGLILTVVIIAVLMESRDVAMVFLENRTIFGIVVWLGAGAAHALMGAAMLTAKPKA